MQLHVAWYDDVADVFQARSHLTVQALESSSHRARNGLSVSTALAQQRDVDGRRARGRCLASLHIIEAGLGSLAQAIYLQITIEDLRTSN